MSDAIACLERWKMAHGKCSCSPRLMLKNDRRQSATRTLKVEHLSLINHNALVNPDCDMNTLMCWLCSLVEHACIDHDPLHYLYQHHLQHLHHQLPSLLLHQRRQGQLSFPIATDTYHDYKLQIKLTAPKKSKKACEGTECATGAVWTKLMRRWAATGVDVQVKND